MKKPSEETKILAHTECLLVWDRTIRTGCKETSIERLFREGKISLKEYIYDCPFCEYLRNNDTFEELYDCDNCIWPGSGFIRCTSPGSPFSKWIDAWGESEKTKAAKAMLKFLLELDY